MIAQTTVVGAGNTETATATIRRIDPTTRFVVLSGDDGSEMGVFAPPEFTRLNELSVGDVVTITYYESVVYQLRRPRARKPSVSEEVSATESTSALPGLTLSHQQTERVTVKAVDRDASSITVTNRDGRTVSRHVERLSDLDGVKPGDHIDITEHRVSRRPLADWAATGIARHRRRARVARRGRGPGVSTTGAFTTGKT